MTPLQERSLLPEHFGFVPEKPSRDEYNEMNFDKYPIPICFDPREELKQLNLQKARIEEEYQEALNQWNFLYGEKPEPEWIDISDKKPIKGQTFRTNNDRRCLTCFGNETWDNTERWYDKQSYDTQLSEWEYHQKRYDWEIAGMVASCDKWDVDFRESGWTHLHGIDGQGVSLKSEQFTIQLFELICKENGIEI